MAAIDRNMLLYMSDGMFKQLHETRILRSTCFPKCEKGCWYYTTPPAEDESCPWCTIYSHKHEYTGAKCRVAGGDVTDNWTMDAAKIYRWIDKHDLWHLTKDELLTAWWALSDETI